MACLPLDIGCLPTPTNPKMTLNYYIKVYHLTETEAENFRSLASAEEDPESKSSLQTYAHRWMMEIRGKCKTKVECRAIMFRYIMDTTIVPNAPAEDRIVLAAWANRITDQIQEIVNRLDIGAMEN